MRVLISPLLVLTAGCLHAGDPAQYPRPGSGLSFVHPTQAPPQASERCRALPDYQKEHTYVFAVNGFDPFCLGNLNGLCDHVRRLGFRHVYFGQFWEPRKMENEIVRVRASDPAARVVLLGYSNGANDARAMCHSLARKDVRIDLLVYLGGDRVLNVPESRPENAGKILNITGHGFVLTGGNLFVNGDDISGAKNVRLKERHILLPSRPAAVEAFLNGLHDVCATVPPS